MRVATGEIAGFVTVFMGVGWTVSGFFAKMVVKDIKGDLKQVIDKLSSLQVEIPQKYVTKHDCEVAINRRLCGSERGINE